MNKKLIISLSITVSLLLSAAGGATYYIKKNKNNKDDLIKTEFQKFIKKYSKSYGTEENDQFQYRFKQFKFNYNFIEENKERTKMEGFEIKINNFADLSFEEFKNIYLIDKSFKKSDDLKKGSDKIDYNFNDIQPRKIDHKNVLTSVKNQGQCGSCWAFSTIGALEGHLVLSKIFKTPTSLSEQELVDCSHNGNQGCEGGLMTQAYDFLKINGAVLEKDYPYKGIDDKCTLDKIKKEDRIKVPEYVTIKDEPNTKGLVKALKNGPVAVAIQATIFFQFYFFGIYRSLPWTGGSLNHGIVATGYDLDNSTPYFEIKNSWGSTWGLSGYAKLAISDRKWGTLGIANENDCYPVFK